MSKVAVFLADGFEEIEALSVVDILRRGGVFVKSVSADDSEFVRGTHEVYVKADTKLSDFMADDFDMLVFPGGLPGATNLAKNPKILALAKDFSAKNKALGAICAAPLVLGEAGVLGENFTCYPGFEANIKAVNSKYKNDANVVKSANIITSKGPATAMEFALNLLKVLKGDEVYLKVKNDLLFV